MKTRVLVRVSFNIELDWPHPGHPEYDTDDHIRFTLEDHSCAGTGLVGARLKEIFLDEERQHDEEGSSTCFACEPFANDSVKVLQILRAAKEGL